MCLLLPITSIFGVTSLTAHFRINNVYGQCQMRSLLLYRFVYPTAKIIIVAEMKKLSTEGILFKFLVGVNYTLIDREKRHKIVGVQIMTYKAMYTHNVLFVEKQNHVCATLHPS